MAGDSKDFNITFLVSILPGHRLQQTESPNVVHFHV